MDQNRHGPSADPKVCDGWAAAVGIPMNERLLVAHANSQAAIPDSAKTDHQHWRMPRVSPGATQSSTGGPRNANSWPSGDRWRDA
jgi:hypothetical protein